MKIQHLAGRKRRKLRIRQHVTGTEARPRLTVFRSAKHIYAQVIDDVARRTLASASTVCPDLRGTVTEDSKTDAAKKVGALVAKICLEKKIAKVVFDRNGFMYHGRIKALADAARKGGLSF
jgi:large subunit ribosomal protein L18